MCGAHDPFHLFLHTSNLYILYLETGQKFYSHVGGVMENESPLGVPFQVPQDPGTAT